MICCLIPIFPLTVQLYFNNILKMNLVKESGSFVKTLKRLEENKFESI